MRRLLTVVFVPLLVAAFAAAPAQAATKPAKGTLSAASPTVKWTGTSNEVNPVECVGPLPCDHFALKIDPIAGKNVKIVVDVPDTFDYDLYVYGPNDTLVASGGGGFVGEDEIAIIKAPKKGTYDVVIQPYFVVPGTTYKASAAFAAPKK